MKVTTRIAVGWFLACGLLLVEAASSAEPQRTRAEQLGLTRGTQGLVPTYRIWAAEMVDSPVDFRQLKPGAKAPKLPPVFSETNMSMDPNGKTVDLNEAFAKRPTLLVMWRG